jgi:hypothetical protein
MRYRCLLLATLFIVPALLADAPGPRPAREALQPLGDLIGSWRGAGTPAGSREEQQKNFWTETIAWEWQFKGQDAWLKVAFDKSKHFRSGELRYAPDRDEYVLKVKTPGGESLSFAGKLDKRKLNLDRDDQGETQRLVFTLLHANRFLYHYEVRPAGKSLFARKYQVGATKEGVAFADGDGRPECIVSGGLGTMPVSYQGKTYYVCCSGCRTEFQEDPAKYVKEFELKKAKQK